MSHADPVVRALIRAQHGLAKARTNIKNGTPVDMPERRAITGGIDDAREYIAKAIRRLTQGD